jgi:hypothetical protein
MFAGHVGVALAIGRAERRINVGAFVIAALLLDALLWLFVLMGWESVRIPPNFALTHQPEFVFPYSHGLLAAGAWSALAAVVTAWLYSRSKQLRWRATILVAAAVFSHWLMDALVHRPELPLAGKASTTVGLALWDHMPLALSAEAAFVVLGLWLFLPGTTLSRGKCIAVVGLAVLLMVFTAVGMTVAPPPPSAIAMAWSSLLTLALVCALFLWLGRLSQARRAGPEHRHL